jgi:hypothetical protein
MTDDPSPPPVRHYRPRRQNALIQIDGCTCGCLLMVLMLFAAGLSVGVIWAVEKIKQPAANHTLRP